MSQLTIVVPCYNEAKNIPLLLSRFKEVLAGSNVRVLLVNNGSTDDSAAVLEQTLPNFPFASTVLVLVNKGYGHGILQGLRHAETEFIGWTHADLQTDPKDVVLAFEMLLAQENPQKTYVKGQRRGRPAFDNIFTLGMSAFESGIMMQPLWDINAQPNLFPRAFFESWDNPPEDFSLDLYAYYMARQQRYKILRFDVQFPERVHGNSSWNTSFGAKWKFIKRTVDFSIKLKSRLSS